MAFSVGGRKPSEPDAPPKYFANGKTTVTRDIEASLYETSAKDGLTVHHLRAFLTECARRGIPDEAEVKVSVIVPRSPELGSNISITSKFSEQIQLDRVTIREENEEPGT